MAEGDITFYNNFKEQVLLGAIDLSTDEIRVTLHNSYTPDKDHNTWADASGTEYAAYGNYTQNGQGLSGSAVAQDDTNDRASWDGIDVTFASLNLSGTTPSDAVLRVVSPDVLICWVELGATATNGGDYTLQWNANGIGLLT